VITAGNIVELIPEISIAALKIREHVKQEFRQRKIKEDGGIVPEPRIIGLSIFHAYSL
jgi:hypothetical protein